MQLILKSWRGFWLSFLPSVVLGTKQSNPKLLLNSVNRRTLMSLSKEHKTSREDLGTSQDVKEIVKKKYGQAALRVVSEGSSSCCGTKSGRDRKDPITSNLYKVDEISELPSDAVL